MAPSGAEVECLLLGASRPLCVWSCVSRGIDIAPYGLSHPAVRVPDWDLYVHQRTLLERHATASLENVWNGRPISKIVLAEPLVVLDRVPVSPIELIPPVHQRVYRMGLEHLGIVVGEDVDAFSREHRATLTEQQFQSAELEPYYVFFEDFTHVKFYRRSLYDACVLEGATFDGSVHVDDWVPQRLETATGQNPLPQRPKLPPGASCLGRARRGSVVGWRRLR